MRYWYSLLLYIILPFLYFRLLWRSRRLPAYRGRMLERMGYFPFKLGGCLWVHAVSVGETLAALPLIRELQARYDVPLLVTTMTPTGAERVKAALGDSVKHVYLPYDTPSAMARFLDTMQPLMGVIIETELWPNLLATCNARNIPVCLMNARLSARSARGYHRVGLLTRQMLKQLTVIAAQGRKDAARFISLGAHKERVFVTGNIKFDIRLPRDIEESVEQLQKTLNGDRFIWLAASTHEGEEELILAAHAKIREIVPESLLVLVPRHPDRFNAVASLCEKSFPTIRRSSGHACHRETAVYLGDTMGDLLKLYSVAQVVFVGGSFVPTGGHNILEPGSLAKPIVTGPHLFNFHEVSELFLKANALVKLENPDQLAETVLQLAGDPARCTKMGEAALKCVLDNRGALDKQLELIDNVFVSQLNIRDSIEEAATPL